MSEDKECFFCRSDCKIDPVPTGRIKGTFN